MATDNTSPLRADPVRSRQIRERIPAGRWGEPGDVAGAAVFLASRAPDHARVFTPGRRSSWHTDGTSHDRHASAPDPRRCSRPGAQTAPDLGGWLCLCMIDVSPADTASRSVRPAVSCSSTTPAGSLPPVLPPPASLVARQLGSELR
jgi:hypothetical protein